MSYQLIDEAKKEELQPCIDGGRHSIYLLFSLRAPPSERGAL